MQIENVKRIGVVGCGLMGAGIVEVCSRAGYAVTVREVDEALLQKGLKRVNTSLSKSVEKGKMTQAEKDAAQERISGTTELPKMDGCDLVIEAVVENIEVKKDIFHILDLICPPETILASNTSALCVTEIASATQRQDKVLGLHFFNPVTVMPLVEIVKGVLTSEETCTLGQALAQKIGKTAVLVRDRPGFIVNLLLIPFLLDAIRWLDGGLATKEEIDAAAKLGLNHPMGPIALSDLIGLDTVQFIADALFEEFRESRYAAPALLRRMVKAGLLGRKTGRGFYSY